MKALLASAPISALIHTTISASITAAVTLAVLAVSSPQAQAATLHATGSTNLNASCGNGFARSIAESEADQNARAQCAGEATRATPYTYQCQVYAHGYATIHIASADYNCK